MHPRPKAPPPTAYQRALRRLGRRDHSVAELRRALLDRGHEPEEVEAEIRSAVLAVTGAGGTLPFVEVTAAGPWGRS